jgi:hypothetical protein
MALSMKNAVAQDLNNKLNIYQQKYNKICEAGATMVLFNVSHILTFCMVTDVWTHVSFVKLIFVRNKYIIFTLMAIRVLVTKHEGNNPHGQCTHRWKIIINRS